MSASRQLAHHQGPSQGNHSKTRGDYDYKKACLSECTALYQVDTKATTKLYCKEQKDCDAGLDVQGRIILSKQCIITPGSVKQDDCDPCITNFCFNICFPVRCEIENSYRESVGRSLVEVTAKNELYNKFKLLHVSKHEDDSHDQSHSKKPKKSDKKHKIQGKAQPSGSAKTKAIQAPFNLGKPKDTARV